MLRYLLLSLAIFTNTAFSASLPPSAQRDPDLSYKLYELQKHHKSSSRTPLGRSRLYTGENLPVATEWASLEELQQNFEKLRDDRFLKWSSHEEFPRRISWLYPNDGCYARAGAANVWFKNQGIKIPKKVFAFGDLYIKTEHTPWGYASWWYHTAPIVEVAGTKYVLDPSIDATQALPLGEWLARMGKPNKIKVAICGEGSYSPNENCDTTTFNNYGVTNAQQFLSKEWNQVKKLHLEPEVILGEEPPW